MNKTFTIQAEVPATKVSLFEAKKSAQLIIAGIQVADRLGANYDVKAIHAFTQNLRGAAGVYEFDIVIDNQFITAENEEDTIKRITDSLPATHKIISIK